jgi:hypothetical protein
MTEPHLRHIDPLLGTPVAEEILEIETTTKLTGELAERLVAQAAAEGKTPVDMMADIVERGLKGPSGRELQAQRAEQRDRQALEIRALRNEIADLRKRLETRADDRRVAALQRELDEMTGKLRAALQRRNERALTFAPDIEQFLKSEAHDRKMTVEVLLQVIIEAVVEDKLFAAVLDN